MRELVINIIVSSSHTLMWIHSFPLFYASLIKHRQITSPKINLSSTGEVPVHLMIARFYATNVNSLSLPEYPNFALK